MLVIAACSPEADDASGTAKVEVVRSDSGYALMRNGEPYVIRGAGMEVEDIERFAAHGGNSIRNWSTQSELQDTRTLLDTAHAHGVTVMLGLPMEAERRGFDYDDAASVARQLELMHEEVLKYRDHPALLAWIIGNELNHSFTNPAVYDAVNDVAMMIDDLDPNHPTTTTVSEFEAELIDTITERAPALDFISFQLYGKLFGLRDVATEIGFEAPFMVTEWGAIGYWEMEQTSWGTPTEMTSTQKAGKFLEGYRDVLEQFEDQLLGNYVFLWGQKQERTPTWFGMFTEAGLGTEAVDTMHYIWNGAWPDNRAPAIDSFLLDGKDARQSVTLSAGQSYAALLDASDPDGDALTFRWEIKPESEATQAGGDYEEPIASLEGLLSNERSATPSVLAPAPGKYRLFAYAFDGNGHAAHANIPFLVEPAD